MGKYVAKILIALFVTSVFGVTLHTTLSTFGLSFDKNTYLPICLLGGAVLYFMTNHLNPVFAVFYRILVCAYGYMDITGKKFHFNILEKIVIVLTIFTVVSVIMKIIQKIKNKKENLDEVGEFAKDSKVFYASMRWKKARLYILQNTHKICGICGSKDHTSWHVDHILPRSMFPKFALAQWNHRRTCPDCNTAKSNQVTSHEIKDLYLNFRNKEEIAEFENTVNANPHYKKLLEEARNKISA